MCVDMCARARVGLHGWGLDCASRILSILQNVVLTGVGRISCLQQLTAFLPAVALAVLVLAACCRR